MTEESGRGLPRTLLALSVLAGVALWLTPAAFDVIVTPDERTTRVAMLPPLWQLPVFMFAAALGLVATVRLLPRSEPPQDQQKPEENPADVLLPTAGLIVLALPYLPGLPDLFPILRVLAGPGKALVWFGVAALIARGFWRALPRHLRLVDASPARVALALFIAGTLLYGGTAMAFTRTILFPGGDEPHYLVLAQSLWRDGDLRIENNHRRGDYREYFKGGDLPPHYLARGKNRQIYSVHPIGLPVVLAPVYAAGGYTLVFWLMSAMAGAAGALAWLVAWRVTASRVAASAAWVACCMNGPWIFNSFTVYPEVPAALMVMAAWLVMTRRATDRARAQAWMAWLACGAAIATLPWLSTKYAPMAAALTLAALGRLWWPEPEPVAMDHAPHPAAGDTLAALPLPKSAALIAPIAISLAGWFMFFHEIWGTFSPSAPYGAQRETRLAYLPSGGPGLLFDQEYGILAFAPALFLGLTGLVAMIAAGGRARRLAIETLAIGGALLGTVGAFHIWWGGSATVGRPIVSGLLLLAVPFAWRYEQQRTKPALIAGYHVLIVAGLAIAVTLALAQGGMLLVGHRSGMSRVLEWLSPTGTLWTIAPAFITQTAFAAGRTALIWIAVALAAGWWLSRRPSSLAPGRATLSAFAALTTSLILVSILVPMFGGRTTGARSGTVVAAAEAAAPTEQAGTNGNSGTPESVDPLVARLRGRGRSDLLDRFDAARRPIAIVYDPWHRIDPVSAPSLVEFVARPDERRARTPIPLLYNARWSLPAGRYTVELIARKGFDVNASSADTIAGTFSLLMGYSGTAAREWEVSMGSPGVWGRTFDLLTDVNLVGFRASPAIEQAAPILRLRPASIVDLDARLRPTEISSSAVLGDTTVYFHDDRLRAEANGFWTPGASTVRVTMASAPGGATKQSAGSKGAALLLRAGPVRTAVELSTPAGWRERALLEPGSERQIPLPASRAGVLRLTIETSSAFVPADVDPASQDRRSLGAWIEMPVQ